MVKFVSPVLLELDTLDACCPTGVVEVEGSLRASSEPQLPPPEMPTLDLDEDAALELLVLLWTPAPPTVLMDMDHDVIFVLCSRGWAYRIMISLSASRPTFTSVLLSLIQ